MYSVNDGWIQPQLGGRCVQDVAPRHQQGTLDQGHHLVLKMYHETTKQGAEIINIEPNVVNNNCKWTSTAARVLYGTYRVYMPICYRMNIF